MIYFERYLLFILFTTIFRCWPDNHCFNMATGLCQRYIKKLNHSNHLFYLGKGFLKVSNHSYDPFLRYLFATKQIIIMPENAFKSSTYQNLCVTCLKNFLECILLCNLCNANKLNVFRNVLSMESLAFSCFKINYYTCGIYLNIRQI